MTRNDDPVPKIGEGHAEAMLRLGLKEIRAAAVLSPDSNIAQPSEYGLYGTKTPGEVADARDPKERDRDEEPESKSILADRLRQAEARDDHERDSKERE